MSQIDDFLDGKAAPSAAPKVSAIDAFLGEDKPKQNKGLASDVLTAVKQGALQLPGVATGILDIAPGALGIDRPASKAADFLGSMTGFQPGKWAKEADAEYSPETRQAKSAVDQAWNDPNKGAADVAAAYLQNPRTIGLAAAQSIPSMLAGGVVGRGLGMAAGINSAAARAAIGEGAVMAGSTMDQIDASVDPQKAAAASLVVGAGGAAISAGGAKIASRFGNVDIDSAIAGGVTAPTGKTMSLAKRVPAGILQEGLLEEAPQSALETGAQNWAEGKPLTEGMTRNVTEGALAGGLMGGGAAALTRQQQAQGLPDPDAGQPPAQPQAPAEQPPATFVNPDAPVSAEPPPVVTPSQAMGIDPNAGAISRVAAAAVDGPASMEMAAQQAEAAIAAEDNPEAGAPADQPIPLEDRPTDELRMALRNAQDPAIRKTIGEELQRRREAPASPDLFAPDQGAANVSNTDAAGALAAGVGGAVGVDADGGGSDAGLLAAATGPSAAGDSAAPGPAVQESDAAPVPGRDSDKALTPKQQKKLEKDILEGVTVGVEFGYGIKQIAKGVKAFPGSMTTEQREDAVRRITQRMGLKVPESRGRKEQMEDPDAQGGWTATPTTPQKPTNLREVIALKKAEKANVQDQPQATAPAAAPAPAEAVQAPQTVGSDGAAQPGAAPAGRAGVEATGVEPQATKADLDKLTVTDMTDAQLQSAVSVYGPDSNRTPKVLKEIERRKASTTPAPAPTTTEPTNAPRSPEAAQAVETKTEGREETALLSDSVSTEPNLEAAKALLARQKAATGNAVAEGKVRKELRDLAAQTPETDTKTVLALDIAATRLGMGEGRLKGLEFKQAESSRLKRDLSGPAPAAAPAVAAPAPSQQAQVPAEPAAAPAPSLQPTAAQATHQDPGEKPEAATKGVVTDSLKTAAKNEDTKPSEMRKWLLAEIDKELLQAPDRADYDEAVKTMGEKDAISMYTGNGLLGKNSETGFITFDVPGDGKFKVRNSVRGLLEFRKNVNATQGFKDNGQKTVKPEQNDGVQGGSGGQMAAITNMIEEGDFEAARDFAEAVGIKLEDVKVPRGDNAPAWKEFLATGKVPEQKPVSREWDITNEQNRDGTWSRVARLKRKADGAEYEATVTGTLDNTRATYVLTKDGKEYSRLTNGQPFSTALELAENAMPAANDKPAPSKAKDTGWNMAGTGYGGKRYNGRNITLDDGRQVVARVYENAGNYDEVEIKVDGVRKFTVRDSLNAEGKADAFIKTLTSTGGDAAAPAAEPKARPAARVTPQISGNPEKFIKVAADSVRELRSVDVDRVLTETPVQFRSEVAGYIKDRRKDLADEVDDVMADLRGGDAAQQSDAYQSAYDTEVERMRELADKKGVPASGINDDLSASLASLIIGRGFDQSIDEFLSANPTRKGRRDAMVAWRNGQIDHKPGQSEWAKRREKAQPAAESETPKLTAEDLANQDKALLDGAISVQDYMDATGLTDEDVGVAAGDGLRQQADREAKAADPYHQGIQKMQEALSDQMRSALDAPSSTPQQRKSKEERMARITRDRATLDMIARGFERPFDNRFVTKLSPMLKARFNKQWESIKTGEFAKQAFQEASYKLWAQKVIDKAREKLGMAAEPAAPAPEAPKKGLAGVRAKKAAEAEAQRAAYFTPGNVVKGYGGHDRVLEYTPVDERGTWSVRVQAVVKQGEQWVDAPRERPRWHSTQPEAKELAAGPVVKAPQESSPDGDAAADYSKRSVDWLRANGGETITITEAIDALLAKQRDITENKANWSPRDAAGHPINGVNLYTKEAMQKLDKIGWGITNLMQHRKNFGDEARQVVEQAAQDKKKAPLSVVVEKVNAKNGDGLTDADRVPEQKPASKTPAIDAHNAAMAAVREGRATAEQFKASFEAAVASKEAIKAELDTMTKVQLLREGGPFVQMRYANEKKAEVVDAVYRRIVGEYALGETVSYGMGKGAYEAAIRRMVDAADDAKLAAYVAERKAAIEEAQASRAARAAAIENPQTLNDYREAINVKVREGMTRKEAFLTLTPEQRIKYDTLEAEGTREAREARKRALKTQVRAADQTTGGQIIATKHTKNGYDLFVVQLSDRLSREDYQTVLASAKKLGGWYSAFRGNGAVPGFQFKDRANADAFLALAGGDTAAAKEQVAQRRDAFEDDRSQTAVERLRAMADKLDAQAAEVEGRERKTNTARRARFASAALNAAAADKAKAKTMRNIADGIEAGKAKFLDEVRTKSQVDMLTSIVDTAKGNELRAKYPSYADQEKRKGEPPTAETADFAEFPSYGAFRSDLATLGRQLLEVDGTKKLGQRLMSVADDVTDAYLEFAKANFRDVSQFGRGDALADFASKDEAERAIKRSGLTGKAIVLPIKRGQNRVILSPSEAIGRGVWQGDGDKRITLTVDFGNELVEAIGRRGNKANKLSVPWQFQNAYDRRKALARIGIETPSEYRSALREFIGLKEQAVANRTRELELQMVGRKADGLDFFPTSAEVADQMVEAADLSPDMAVLEPSAGMGHLADRIREAGAEPDVIEISPDRRELLEGKGYHLADVDDFMQMEPRKFFTYGDVFRAPDGTEGIMRGGNSSMGSDRVMLVGEDGHGVGAGFYNRSELVGVRHRGTDSGYDRIIMNPPFSNRRDAEHVRHAYALLKPGGRIVAIMGEGVFFGQDKKAQDFREWLDSVGGTSEKLPEGSFMDPSLPVNTAVSARMVVIDKPAANTADVVFSQGLLAPASLGPKPTADQIQRMVDKVQQVAKNALPVTVTASPSDVPGLKVPAGAKPTGVLTGGRVYLFADNIRSTGEAYATLFHELFHLGLQKVIPAEDYAAMLGKFSRNLLVQKYVRDWKASPEGVEKAATMPAAAYDALAAEEALAMVSEELAVDGIGTRNMPGMVKAMLSWLANVADRLGFPPSFSDWVRGLTRTDAEKFVSDMVRAAMGGEKNLDATRAKYGTELAQMTEQTRLSAGRDEAGPTVASSRGDNARMTEEQAREQGFTLKAYRGVSKATPFNDTGTTWLTTSREVAEAYAEEVMGYDDPGVLEVMVKPDALPRFDASRLSDEQRAELAADDFGNPQAVGIYDRSDDHPLGGSRRNVTVIHAPREAVVVLDTNGADGVKFRSTPRELAGMAADQLKMTLTAPGKLSWWSKTVGTMYGLAERHPAFKPVFNAAQSFIDDVSYYATEAADMAPKMLPKLESWRDIAKSPISAEDNKAIEAPINEGTLLWARDESGRPVKVAELEAQAADMTADQKARRLLRNDKISDGVLKMWQGLPQEQYEKLIDSRYESQMLAPGVVWTDAELKAIWKLNDTQIGLYREVRAAIDKSLDNLAKSDLVRFVGKDGAGIKDAIMEADSVDEAALMARDYFIGLSEAEPDRAEMLLATANGVMDRADKVTRLKAQGYAPLSRFGKYTVDVVTEDGRQYFGLFESMREANQMAARMKGEFGKDAVSQGTLSDESFKLFQGITPETLELFGNMLGLSDTGDTPQDQAFQAYLKLTKNNRSAMKRLIQRKGILGYSQDVGRVLANFIYSNARQTASALHIGDLTDAINAIPQGQGEVKDVAVKLGEYIKNPQEEAQAFRGLLFAQYLGGNISSAIINALQPFQVSFPYLSQFGGVKQAGAEMMRATKEVATGKKQLDPELAAAIKRGEDDGTLSPQEVFQLMAQAKGAGSLRSGDGTVRGELLAKGGNAWSKTALAWGKVFGVAEQFNRRSTFIAAYRIAKAQKIADPFAFAKKTVKETQFVYSKANRPQWARGAIGSTIFTFKTYSISYIELLHRMATQGGPEGKRAALLAVAVLLLMGGAGGLPFMEDGEDIADTIAQVMGYNFSSKQAKQELLEELFGEAAAQFIDRGISGVAGVPIDVSGRFGMGNLIPGTGAFLQRNSNARDVLEVLGPAGDLIQRGKDSFMALAKGNVYEAGLNMSPVAIRNLAKGADMADTGMYRDTKGFKVIETTGTEAGLKAIGFQPNTVAKVQEANYLMQRQKDFYNTTAQNIRAKWARGLFEQDDAMVAEAREAINTWNEKNPDQRMSPNMPAIWRRVREMAKDKDQRIADTAPKAMRQQFREETARVREAL